ncbi:MAG TPA: RraA family protein [Dehalococcoidia bacterium]|nr:RraA family protein [Dehalococcoidia bacterium]
MHALVARLARLDSCAVSDALDRLGLAGTVTGIRCQTGTAKIAGRVVTVRLGPPDGTASTRHLGTAAIEAAAPGDVIVIDHQGRDDAAGWGGILSTAAQIRGVAGTIVDGACRDVDEARERGFPVFARGAVPLTARGRAVEQAFNEPVTIGGASVQPGDLVIADGSGVVFVSAKRAGEVLETAEGIAAREAEMTRAVLAGRPVSEVMGANYESMLHR